MKIGKKLGFSLYISLLNTKYSSFFQTRNSAKKSAAVCRALRPPMENGSAIHTSEISLVVDTNNTDPEHPLQQNSSEPLTDAGVRPTPETVPETNNENFQPLEYTWYMWYEFVPKNTARRLLQIALWGIFVGTLYYHMRTKDKNHIYVMFWAPIVDVLLEQLEAIKKIKSHKLFHREPPVLLTRPLDILRWRQRRMSAAWSMFRFACWWCFVFPLAHRLAKGTPSAPAVMAPLIICTSLRTLYLVWLKKKSLQTHQPIDRTNMFFKSVGLNARIFMQFLWVLTLVGIAGKLSSRLNHELSWKWVLLWPMILVRILFALSVCIIWQVVRWAVGVFCDRTGEIANRNLTHAQYLRGTTLKERRRYSFGVICVALIYTGVIVCVYFVDAGIFRMLNITVPDDQRNTYLFRIFVPLLCGMGLTLVGFLLYANFLKPYASYLAMKVAHARHFERGGSNDPESSTSPRPCPSCREPVTEILWLGDPKVRIIQTDTAHVADADKSPPVSPRLVANSMDPQDVPTPTSPTVRQQTAELLGKTTHMVHSLVTNNIMPVIEDGENMLLDLPHTDCSICCDKEAEAVFLPCGHGGVCVPCARSWVHPLLSAENLANSLPSRIDPISLVRVSREFYLVESYEAREIEENQAVTEV